MCGFFFFSSRRRHTRSDRDWSSDVCSSDLQAAVGPYPGCLTRRQAAACALLGDAVFARRLARRGGVAGAATGPARDFGEEPAGERRAPGGLRERWRRLRDDRRAGGPLT